MSTTVHHARSRFHCSILTAAPASLESLEASARRIQPAERLVLEQPRSQTIPIVRPVSQESGSIRRAVTLPHQRSVDPADDASDSQPHVTVPVNEGRPPHMAACFLDIRSRVWVSYRHSFPPLPDTGLTSDVGWGCMIRAAQMLVANTLEIHLLQRGTFFTFVVLCSQRGRLAIDVTKRD